MPKPLGNSSRYMPGLDGLRAIAVLAVIAYHLNLGWVPGGLLGVTMFFVLSGYLITDILLRQLRSDQPKSFDFKTFLIRRARRLLPAMFIMLAAVSLYLAITDPSRLISLEGDIGSALLYINNWWLIFHEVSYFESFGPASPFGHLWSLAVEEQFYLVWPLILLIVIRFVPKRGKLALWTLAAAALSAGAMTLLYEPGADPSRVYYGTDTRAFALLIGAALAVVWPSWKLTTAISRQSRIALDTIAAIGFASILLMIGTVGEYDSFLYQGGMVLFAIATTVVVAALSHPASRLAHLIGSKAFTWVGVRSYGIYLYHYPIIVLTTRAAESGEFQPVRAAIQLILTFVFAELSYRFIEEPIRRGALESGLRTLKAYTNHRLRSPKLKRSSSYLAAAMLVVTCVSCTSSVDSQSSSSLKPNDTTESHAPVNKPAEETISEIPASKPTDTEASKPIVSEPEVTEQPSPVPQEEEADKEQSSITAIGDSVLLDAGPYLEERYPGIVIDGKIGRQFSHAAAIIEELKKANQLGDTVIIELGTNGAFTTKQMNELLEVIGGERDILLVNTRVPRKWQDSVNKMLAATASKTANVTVVDWYAASKGKEDFFSGDGVHLTKHGAEYYADVLTKAIDS
ncbi:hypothetical protein BK133_06880 [Paenibacillus sp. FSL H8-0548]|uniref:acyltransferase family protein n=1 Tax=Paenibacillus sp. FSL H8-0548 TaxID=1920422 RepID=UPI00096DECA5|nr:acyltransferase family protein [Paenibacillus sp. FSL H8-0548]OMF37316.1 hypothetical protein BK133_06880 [Paenibacillus sp. FSL H8-0548]